MKTRPAYTVLGVVFGACLAAPAPRVGAASRPWLKDFPVTAKDLVTTGRNAYFILEPGHELTLEERDQEHLDRLVITVLDETATVGGVETRVVEERETRDGIPVEVSRNYFAIHAATGDLYYFGEDVDKYDHGKVSGHPGEWHHGKGSARFGLFLPGAPAVGARYYQEQAPGVALDRAEVESVTERVATPAGVFEGCLKTKETTPLEPFVKERKLYAPGVGLIQDGDLKLVAHGPRGNRSGS